MSQPSALLIMAVHSFVLDRLRHSHDDIVAFKAGTMKLWNPHLPVFWSSTNCLGFRFGARSVRCGRLLGIIYGGQEIRDKNLWLKEKFRATDVSDTSSHLQLRV